MLRTLVAASGRTLHVPVKLADKYAGRRLIVQYDSQRNEFLVRALDPMVDIWPAQGIEIT